jgi:hypothetical protein
MPNYPLTINLYTDLILRFGRANDKLLSSYNDN